MMIAIASGSEYGDNIIRMQSGMVMHLGRDEKWEPIEANAEGAIWRIADSSNFGKPTYIAEPCYLDESRPAPVTSTLRRGPCGWCHRTRPLTDNDLCFGCRERYEHEPHRLDGRSQSNLSLSWLCRLVWRCWPRRWYRMIRASFCEFMGA